MLIKLKLLCLAVAIIFVSCDSSEAPFNIDVSGVWFETAYAEWTTDNSRRTFTVEMSRDGGDWQPVDTELVRRIDGDGNRWRVDVPGLQNTGAAYEMRIIPNRGAYKTIDNIVPVPFDRQGYAFAGGNATGGYNEDGTVPYNARIIYVTAANVNDVLTTSDFPYDGIMDDDATAGGGDPLIIRFIGTIGDVLGTTLTETTQGLDLIPNVARGSTGGSGANTFNTRMMVIQSTSNVTLEGIGPDAVIRGWSFLIRESSNVVVRNLTIDQWFEDAVGVHGGQFGTEAAPAPLSAYTHNIWVHHNRFTRGQDSSGVPGRDDDHAAGDGAVDITNGATGVTVAYNIFYGSDKTMLIGGNRNSLIGMVTVHHNHFIDVSQRMPRVRFAQIHVFNNLYEDIGPGVRNNTAIGASHLSSVVVEGNTFYNISRPLSRHGGANAEAWVRDGPGALLTAETAGSAAFAGRTLIPNTITNARNWDAGLPGNTGAGPFTLNGHTHTFVPFEPAINTTLSDIGVQTADVAEKRVREWAGPMRR